MATESRERPILRIIGPPKIVTDAPRDRYGRALTAAEYRRPAAQPRCRPTPIDIEVIRM
jgi:hypothetical protein